MSDYSTDELFEVFIKWINLFQFTANPIANIFDLSDGVVLFKLLCKLSPTYFDIHSIDESPLNRSSENNNIIKLKQSLEYFMNDVLDLNISIQQMIDHNEITSSCSSNIDNIHIHHFVRLIELVLICSIKCENKSETIDKIQSLSIHHQEILMKILQTLMKNNNNITSSEYNQPSPSLNIYSIETTDNEDIQSTNSEIFEWCQQQIHSKNAKINALKERYKKQDKLIKENNDIISMQSNDNDRLLHKVLHLEQRLKHERNKHESVINESRNEYISSIKHCKCTIQLITKQNESLKSELKRANNSHTKLMRNNKTIRDENTLLHHEINRLEQKLLSYDGDNKYKLNIQKLREENMRLMNKLNMEEKKRKEIIKFFSERIIKEQEMAKSESNKYTLRIQKIEKERDILWNKLNTMENEIEQSLSLENEVKKLKQWLLNELSNKNKIIEQQKQEISKLKISMPIQLNSNIDGNINYQCPAMKLAVEIFNNYFSEIPSEFMDHSNDQCYCQNCHQLRGDNEVYFRGKPAKKYALPIGWNRFGLNVDAGKCKMNNIWNDWHVAYHGCSMETTKEIFKSGLMFLKPGDSTITGRKLKISMGHIQKGGKRFNEYTKQFESFGPKNIFVSPSIKYASGSAYSKGMTSFDGKYRIQCVFQLRIRPKSYRIGQETIGATRRGDIIDSEFNNNELEWYTKENLGIVIHGLLLNIQSNTSH